MEDPPSAPLSNDDDLLLATQNLAHSMEKLVEHRIVAQNRLMGQEELLDPEMEAETEKEWSNMNILKQTMVNLSVSSPMESEWTEDDIKEIEEPMISEKEALASLVELARLFKKQSKTEFTEALMVFASLRHTLLQQQAEKCHQRKLNDWFVY
ncbi:hypothetical protein CALCODRAFT_481681 [Calocera cornea HHB12733]|uniref:Uncharacterized protein n=1 Tax=Calocera cornea HHB12733 TaxID=1353952 RepID=A0A165HGK5_9BASI|nr:hypothetical protein CALCODRAFT_481681 [Calocera cornea HHB12733]